MATSSMSLESEEEVYMNNVVYNVFILHGATCRRSWERRVKISSIMVTLIFYLFFITVYSIDNLWQWVEKK